MKDTATDKKKKLQVFRDMVLRLARLQRELRTVLRADFDRFDGTLGSFADVTGVSWMQLNGFFNKRQVICGGVTLERMVNRLCYPDLQTRILAAAKNIPSQYQGMAAFSDQAITMAFGILIRYQDFADEFNFERFSRVFDAHYGIVLKVLRLSKEGVRALENDDVRAEIQAMLDGVVLEQRLASAEAQYRDAFEQKVRELNSLVDQLRQPEYYGSLADVARALGVHRTTLFYARQGSKTAEGSLDEMISNARKRLAATKDMHEQIPKPVAQVPNRKATPDSLSLAEVLAAGGGGVSPLGVPFALTSSSFRDIDGDPGTELVEFTQRQVRLVRALLNVLAQLKDNELRKAIRERLGLEVEELHATIKLFTFSYPNRLTQVFDAERETWLADQRNSRRLSPSRRKKK